MLHARREALLAPLLLSGLVIALTLAIIPRRLAAGITVDAQTVAALLLVPFALSAYYVRSSEHVYVTHMLRGVRIVAVVPVVAALVVIAMLALHQLEPARRASPTQQLPLDVACAGGRASMLAVALLVVAMAAPGLGSKVSALRRLGFKRLAGVLALASLVAVAAAASLLLLVAGLPLFTSMLVAAAAVELAWLVVLLGVAVLVATAGWLHLRGFTDIRRLPKRLRQATVAVLLAAELAVALAGGWFAYSALANGSC